jgi:hypothetical protein
VTKEEIAKTVNEWGAKRDTRRCPMASRPNSPVAQCLKEACRFYAPHISGRIVGPNLPPLFDLQWVCMFDQMLNQIGEGAQKAQGISNQLASIFAILQHKGKGLFIPPGSGPN